MGVAALPDSLPSAARSATRFGPFSHEVRELRDARETVIASVVFRAEGVKGGVAVEQPEFHVWTCRDREIIRFAWFRSLGEALEAAGLRG